MFKWFHTFGFKLWRFLRREPPDELTTIILVKQKDLRPRAYGKKKHGLFLHSFGHA